MTDFDNKFLNCFNWLKMNHFNHLHVHKILLVFGSLSIKNTLFTDFTKYLIITCFEAIYKFKICHPDCVRLQVHA